MKYVDNFLNSKPMYRLVLESLSVLAGLSIFFGLLGIISHNGISLIVSLIVICLVCYVSNYIFAKIVSATRNIESVFITALILFFIFAPAVNLYGYGVLALASTVAMASKYVLAIQKKHIFNPAGIAVFILGLFGLGNAIWWIATPVLLPFVAVIGFLTLRKTDKFRLFFSFAIVAFVTILGFAMWKGADIFGVISQVFISWPLIFFGTIMLIEPLTMPPSNKQQLVYALIVGFLFGAQFHLGPIYSTPALALVIGNIYSFFISPKYFAKITLRQKKQLAPDIYEFAFSTDKKLNNIPGQYMEWTLSHDNVDNRGTRRYFTVTSSPTESDIKIGVRVSSEKGSSFKKQLLDLNVGDSIIASRLMGDFILPKESDKKLVFIAGGIGVTPFRSIIQYLIDTQNKRVITFLYSNKTAFDVVYKEIFDRAEVVVGLKTVYVLTNPETDLSPLQNAVRTIDENTIKQQVPDYLERIFYISGPSGMVTAFKTILTSMEIAEENIKTDFFPGFAQN